MKKNGQHQKMLDLCSDGDWKCQGLFWNISKSPHKRRGELEQLGYLFEERRCVHGIKLSKDFRLVQAPKKTVYRYEQKPDDTMVEIAITV